MPCRKSDTTGACFGVGPLAVWAWGTQVRFSRYRRKTVAIGQVVLARSRTPSNDSGVNSWRVNSCALARFSHASVYLEGPARTVALRSGQSDASRPKPGRGDRR